jgi:hypothetical protein
MILFTSLNFINIATIKTIAIAEGAEIKKTQSCKNKIDAILW